MSKAKIDSSVIALNKKARHEFAIERTIEAGLALEGWEVKSLRAGRAQITDSYVTLRNQEAWLLGAHITPLNTASTHIQPDPIRTRKLLMHRAELNKLRNYVDRQGYAITVLKLYWKNNRVKAEIGLAKGKKLHDKRADIKQREWNLQKQRQFKEK